MTSQTQLTRKPWTEVEIGIILSNWDNKENIAANVRQLSKLLKGRSEDAIKRELYDFHKRGVLRFEKGKLLKR